MDLATGLRRKADQCRRMAKIATSGGHRADRQLLALADEFDRRAAELESLAGFEEKLGVC